MCPTADCRFALPRGSEVSAPVGRLRLSGVWQTGRIRECFAKAKPRKYASPGFLYKTPYAQAEAVFYFLVLGGLPVSGQMPDRPKNSICMGGIAFGNAGTIHSAHLLMIYLDTPLCKYEPELHIYSVGMHNVSAGTLCIIF